MGMYLSLAAVDDETIRRVLSDPRLVWRVLEPDEPEIYEQSLPETRSSWWSRLLGQKPSPSTEARATIPRPIEETDLDKSWHAIHYLLTGTAWEGEPPLNFLLLGGTEIGDIDVGYGVARAISPEETKTISDALSEIEPTTLIERFNPVEMMKLQIYPDIWDRQDERDELIEYCVDNFKDLKEFFSRAATGSLGIIISVQ